VLVLTACDSTTRATGTGPPSRAALTDTPITTAISTAPSTPTAPAATVAPTGKATPVTAETLPTPSHPPLSPTKTTSATPAASLFDVGAGCVHPPDDYSRAEINGETLNGRTLWMLQYAASLYDGPGDLLRVTQGSYTTDETSSFGTHGGGGAVDLSIRNPADPAEALWNETDAMVLALRRAGFAAWYRAPGDLGPGSPAHIHAIAIGDHELSRAALEQLIGPGGYFSGFDGLPPEYGGPHPDRHGNPIICPWMIELGYRDLRE
jgi:hypothetical protein